MSEEIRYGINDLSELEYMLIINALKVWGGDFGKDIKVTEMWVEEIHTLLNKIPKLS